MQLGPTALYRVPLKRLHTLSRPVCPCRERAAYLYAAGPWSLAQVTVEIPFLIVQGILYTLIVYWCTGQSANAGERLLSGQQRSAALQPGWTSPWLSAASAASWCSGGSVSQ